MRASPVDLRVRALRSGAPQRLLGARVVAASPRVRGGGPSGHRDNPRIAARLREPRVLLRVDRHVDERERSEEHVALAGRAERREVRALPLRVERVSRRHELRVRRRERRALREVARRRLRDVVGERVPAGDRVERRRERRELEHALARRRRMGRVVEEVPRHVGRAARRRVARRRRAVHHRAPGAPHRVPTRSSSRRPRRGAPSRARAPRRSTPARRAPRPRRRTPRPRAAARESRSASPRLNSACGCLGSLASTRSSTSSASPALRASTSSAARSASTSNRRRRAIQRPRRAIVLAREREPRGQRVHVALRLELRERRQRHLFARARSRCARHVVPAGVAIGRPIGEPRLHGIASSRRRAARSTRRRRSSRSAPAPRESRTPRRPRAGTNAIASAHGATRRFARAFAIGCTLFDARSSRSAGACRSPTASIIMRSCSARAHWPHVGEVMIAERVRLVRVHLAVDERVESLAHAAHCAPLSVIASRVARSFFRARAGASPPCSREFRGARRCPGTRADRARTARTPRGTRARATRSPSSIAPR